MKRVIQRFQTASIPLKKADLYSGKKETDFVLT